MKAVRDFVDSIRDEHIILSRRSHTWECYWLLEDGRPGRFFLDYPFDLDFAITLHYLDRALESLITIRLKWRISIHEKILLIGS